MGGVPGCRARSDRLVVRQIPGAPDHDRRDDDKPAPPRRTADRELDDDREQRDQSNARGDDSPEQAERRGCVRTRPFLVEQPPRREQQRHGNAEVHQQGHQQRGGCRGEPRHREGGDRGHQRTDPSSGEAVEQHRRRQVAGQSDELERQVVKQSEHREKQTEDCNRDDRQVPVEALHPVAVLVRHQDVPLVGIEPEITSPQLGGRGARPGRAAVPVAAGHAPRPGPGLCRRSPSAQRASRCRGCGGSSPRRTG